MAIRRYPVHRYPAHYYPPQEPRGVRTSSVVNALGWIVFFGVAGLVAASILYPSILPRPMTQPAPTTGPVVPPQVEQAPAQQAQPAPQIEQAPAVEQPAAPIALPATIPTAVIVVPEPTAIVVPAAAPIRIAPQSDARPTPYPTVAVTAPMVQGEDFQSPSATCVETERGGNTVHYSQIQDMSPDEKSSVADYLRTGMIEGKEGPCP